MRVSAAYDLTLRSAKGSYRIRRHRFPGKTWPISARPVRPDIKIFLRRIHADAYHPAVSIERSWKPEAVLMLGAAIVLCLSAGTFASLAVKAALPGLSPGQLRFATFLMSAASFQIAGIILVHHFLKLHEASWRQFLGLDDTGLSRAIGLAIAVTVIVLPAVLGLNRVSELVLTQIQGTPSTQPTMQALEASQGPWQRIIFAFAAIILAPLIEETLFRGILYRTGQQMGYPRLSLYGTSLLFALIHLSLMTLLPLTVLAIILARLYDYTNRLIVPVLVHSLFNAVNFFVYVNRDELKRWFETLTQ